MTEMCKIREPYRCPFCREDMLFFTTGNNMLLEYKRAFLKYGSTSMEFKKYLYSHNINHLKCLKCNKSFIIDWTTGYPIPVIDKKIMTRFTHKG